MIAVREKKTPKNFQICAWRSSVDLKKAVNLTLDILRRCRFVSRLQIWKVDGVPSNREEPPQRVASIHHVDDFSHSPIIAQRWFGFFISLTIASARESFFLSFLWVECCSCCVALRLRKRDSPTSSFVAHIYLMARSPTEPSQETLSNEQQSTVGERGDSSLWGIKRQTEAASRLVEVCACYN